MPALHKPLANKKHTHWELYIYKMTLPKHVCALTLYAGLLVVLATAGSGLFPEALEAGKEGEQNLLQKMKQAGAMEKKRGVLKKGMQRMRSECCWFLSG